MYVSFQVHNVFLLTEWAIDLAIMGPMIPGRVPALLVIPMRTPENLGAMSI